MAERKSHGRKGGPNEGRVMELKENGGMSVMTQYIGTCFLRRKQKPEKIIHM